MEITLTELINNMKNKNFREEIILEEVERWLRNNERSLLQGYWKDRCELAEYLMSPDAQLLQPQYSKWREYVITLNQINSNKNDIID